MNTNPIPHRHAPASVGRRRTSCRRRLRARLGLCLAFLATVPSESRAQSAPDTALIAGARVRMKLHQHPEYVHATFVRGGIDSLWFRGQVARGGQHPLARGAIAQLDQYAGTRGHSGRWALVGAASMAAMMAVVSSSSTYEGGEGVHPGTAALAIGIAGLVGAAAGQLHRSERWTPVSTAQYASDPALTDRSSLLDGRRAGHSAAERHRAGRTDRRIASLGPPRARTPEIPADELAAVQGRDFEYILGFEEGFAERVAEREQARAKAMQGPLIVGSTVLLVLIGRAKR